MPKASPWWSPHVYADRRPFLKTRGAITAAVRHFFQDQGFFEVETACLQVSPGLETHLRAFETTIRQADLNDATLFLHTSPEIACKKLLAAGEEKIFNFARVFRNGERTALHHPEFTMLEWYRARTPYEAVMEDCAALLTLAAKAAGAKGAAWGGVSADFNAPARKITVAQAFWDFVGVDLLKSLHDPQKPDAAYLAAQARRLGVRVIEEDDWSDIFSKILSSEIEPRLGVGQPDFLIEYPAPEAALARLKPDDPRVAERFELYVCGVELANGYGELVDARQQKRRAQAAMERRSARYGQAYPIDDDFIAAVAAMPPASGVALGFDRLVMLASGAPSIDKVLWTPVAEATS